MTPGRGRICFHSAYLYPRFAAQRIELTGGAEVQQEILIRGLAARGFEISAVTCDFGQPDGERIDRITFLRTFRPRAGVPVLRFFHPRLSRTLAALARADADVYYARGAGLWAGVTADVARGRGAGFVFGAAHDSDARRDLPLLSSPRDRWWYRRALRSADAVVAQTRTQQELFRLELGRESEVLANLVEIPDRAGDAGAGRTLLWVATYKSAKHPSWFVELARRMPEHAFVMCGVVPPPPESLDEWNAVRAAARGLPNLEVHGYEDRTALAALYRRAALFVHTSPTEGFPNTVLEAWAHGVPALARVDPDGVLTRAQLGEKVETLDDLEAAARRWMADPSLRRAAGERARAYVRQSHAPEPGLDRVAALFDRVTARVRERRGR